MSLQRGSFGIEFDDRPGPVRDALASMVAAQLVIVAMTLKSPLAASYRANATGVELSMIPSGVRTVTEPGPYRSLA